MTPLNIAFQAENVKHKISEWLIDLCFAVDIFVIFFSAYYDEELAVVDTRSEINKNYI